ncbi:MAG: right-handed parallel beta-helix repeat-containing protein [Phycisphaerae bacterium]
MEKIAILAVSVALMTAVCASGAEHIMVDNMMVLYVSPEGDNAWSGRLPKRNAAGDDGPLATISAARDVIRRLRREGPLEKPVVVYVRGGTYFLDQPLTLTPADSGTRECPVTYAAYPGEEPVLSGGVAISDWRTDESGRWVVDLASVREGQWWFRQLFVDGRRRQRPRLPSGAPQSTFRVAGLGGIDAESAWTPCDRFEFAPGDVDGDWRNLQDVEVVVLHFWVDSHLPIERVDSDRNIVHFTRSTRRRVTDNFTDRGARYYVENVFEAMDTPGQWYLDRQVGRLYYLPVDGERPEETSVVAPRLTHLIRFEGEPQEQRYVEHVHLRGLTLRHNEWKLPPDDAGDLQAASNVPGAVRMRGARFCGIRDCTLEQLGTYAVELSDGCQAVRIQGNEMRDLGAGGVTMSGGGAGSPARSRTAGNIITDNRIHHTGEVFHSAVGVLCRHSGDNVVAYNEIHHTYYTGISVGWVWGYSESVASNNRVEYNHIHHIGQGLLSDMGGIYTLGPQPGSVLRGNVIHDVVSHGYGGWGIYTDEGSSDILIEGNLVYRTTTGGFHQHYGRENVVVNNVFAFSAGDQIQRSRMEDHLSFTFARNIVLWRSGKLLGKNWSDDKFRCDFNCYWKLGGETFRFAGQTLEQWRRRGNDRNSIIADPGFADPAEGDFRLSSDSPAVKLLGFEPIDASRAGPRDEE